MNNQDMIAKGFWVTKGNEIKISRSDDCSNTALLKTTCNCLRGTKQQKVAVFECMYNLLEKIVSWAVVGKVRQGLNATLPRRKCHPDPRTCRKLY